MGLNTQKIIFYAVKVSKVITPAFFFPNDELFFFKLLLLVNSNLVRFLLQTQEMYKKNKTFQNYDKRI